MIFTQTFEFTSEHQIVNDALEIMKENIFDKILVTTTNFHQCSMTIHHWMECYNVTGEPDDNDLLDINIPDLDGMHAVEEAGISSDLFLSPLKIKKINIGLSKNPKFTNIGDYWDDESVGNIIDLLHEFQDMFPTNVYKMKGIVGGLGEMKIPLRLSAKPVKQ